MCEVADEGTSDESVHYDSDGDGTDEDKGDDHLEVVDTEFEGNQAGPEDELGEDLSAARFDVDAPGDFTVCGIVGDMHSGDTSINDKSLAHVGDTDGSWSHRPSDCASIAAVVDDETEADPERMYRIVENVFTVLTHLLAGSDMQASLQAADNDVPNSLVPPQNPPQVAVEHILHASIVEGAPTQSGRKRKGRDLADLGLCLCGERAAGGSGSIKCQHSGCETQWVSFSRHQECPRTDGGALQYHLHCVELEMAPKRWTYGKESMLSSTQCVGNIGEDERSVERTWGRPRAQEFPFIDMCLMTYLLS
ncbi:hypothetical protein OF83DRAFT_1088833 [Amylostereum chailletii]|nr:hypothetical protein OF83DRAFT_1088833 [Amylostereum chailletii]